MTRKVSTQLLVVATLLLAGLPVAAHAACELKRYASVDIELNPNGSVLVPLQVNGHDVWMALNMASGLPMISPNAVTALGLKTGAVMNNNTFFNGAKIKQQVKADSLRIGGADFTGWTIYVVPGRGRPLNFYKGRPMIGTLSAVFMNVVDLELDLANRKISLFKQAYCNGKQVYWGGDVVSARLYSDTAGLLYFPMELDGKNVETSLNTAGRRSFLSERVTRDFFGFAIGSPGVTSETVRSGNGPITFGLKRMSLTAKGLAITDLPVSVDSNRGGPRCTPSRARDSGAIGFDGCVSLVPFELGTDILSQLRIYIASKESRIYFTRAAAPAPATEGANGADPNVPAADGVAAPPTAAATPDAAVPNQ